MAPLPPHIYSPSVTLRCAIVLVNETSYGRIAIYSSYDDNTNHLIGLKVSWQDHYIENPFLVAVHDEPFCSGVYTCSVHIPREYAPWDLLFSSTVNYVRTCTNWCSGNEHSTLTCFDFRSGFSGSGTAQCEYWRLSMCWQLQPSCHIRPILEILTLNEHQPVPIC